MQISRDVGVYDNMNFACQPFVSVEFPYHEWDTCTNESDVDYDKPCNVNVREVTMYHASKCKPQRWEYPTVFYGVADNAVQ